jgi:lipopolysaccharide export system permease protein
LIGALLGLGQLAAANELTVIRVSGVSIWRLARALMLGAGLLAGAALVLSELIAPNTQRYAIHLKSMALDQRLTVIESQGVWAKDGNVYVNVRRLGDGGRLTGVYLYALDADGRLTSAAVATSAVHGPGGWVLEGLRETRLGDDRTETLNAPTRDWQSSLDPDLLDSFVFDYDSLSALALYRYSDYLRDNGLDSNDVDIYLWSRAALPINIVLLVLLALPFAFGPLRQTGTGQRVIAGVMIGIVFYTAGRALLHSGTVFDLHPLLTNFSPTIVLAAITGFALLRVERAR